MRSDAGSPWQVRKDLGDVPTTTEEPRRLRQYAEALGDEVGLPAKILRRVPRAAQTPSSAARGSTLGRCLFRDSALPARTTAVHLHVLQHLEDMVVRRAWWDDGLLYGINTTGRHGRVHWSRWCPYYVDDEGLLQEIPPGRRARRVHSTD